MESNNDRPRNKPPGAWTFFRQWLRHPLSIAAISPSSRQLARLMVSELPTDCRRVIELGGGTGVFTQALLDRGIEADDLMVVELNEELHHHLSRRFPDAHVVLGDACHLDQAAKRCGYDKGGKADAVISGLGLLSMSHDTQRDILRSAFEQLRPGGRFIQFTYGPACPVARNVISDLGLNARRGGFALFNVPPATVYVMTASRSVEARAQRMGEPIQDRRRRRRRRANG